MATGDRRSRCLLLLPSLSLPLRSMHHRILMLLGRRTFWHLCLSVATPLICKMRRRLAKRVAFLFSCCNSLHQPPLPARDPDAEAASAVSRTNLSFLKLYFKVGLEKYAYSLSSLPVGPSAVLRPFLRFRLTPGPSLLLPHTVLNCVHPPPPPTRFRFRAQRATAAWCRPRHLGLLGLLGILLLLGPCGHTTVAAIAYPEGVLRHEDVVYTLEPPRLPEPRSPCHISWVFKYREVVEDVGPRMKRVVEQAGLPCLPHLIFPVWNVPWHRHQVWSQPHCNLSLEGAGCLLPVSV